MRKFACFLFAILLIFSGIASFAIPIYSAVASDSSQEIVILDRNFASNESSLASYGILESETSQNLPVFVDGQEKVQGKSFAPELSGDATNKYIDSSINVDSSVASLNTNDFQLNKMALEMWVRFDLKPGQMTRGLCVELASQDGTNKIYWNMSVQELKSLVTRTELNEYDKKLFDNDINNATIGWVKLSLPISVGITTGELVTENKFNFTKLNLKQTTSYASEVKLEFFDIKIVEKDVDAKDRITSKINDYCIVLVKSSAEVDDGSDYYIGELFPQFLATKSVYSSLYVGDENYLDGNHYNDLKIRVDSGLAGNSVEYYSYGSYNFKMQSHNYNISYGFYCNERFISVLSDNITVSDYGKGVWLEEIDGNFRVGDTKKINYTVHKAFNNAKINFETTNDEIIKIVEVNKTSHYIVVECLKTGNVGINIKIEDARLEGTEFEDVGISNQDYKIQVLKMEKNTNTTKVMLWVALGLLSAGLVYVAIKAIIDSRKVEVK